MRSKHKFGLSIFTRMPQHHIETLTVIENNTNKPDPQGQHKDTTHYTICLEPDTQQQQDWPNREIHRNQHNRSQHGSRQHNPKRDKP